MCFLHASVIIKGACVLRYLLFFDSYRIFGHVSLYNRCVSLFSPYFFLCVFLTCICRKERCVLKSLLLLILMGFFAYISLI
jgi:hypothetical protein